MDHPDHHGPSTWRRVIRCLSNFPQPFGTCRQRGSYSSEQFEKFITEPSHSKYSWGNTSTWPKWNITNPHVIFEQFINYIQKEFPNSPHWNFIQHSWNGSQKWRHPGNLTNGYQKMMIWRKCTVSAASPINYAVTIFGGYGIYSSKISFRKKKHKMHHPIFLSGPWRSHHNLRP